MLNADSVFQKSRLGVSSQRRVSPPAVVERFDVVEQISDGFVPCRVAGAMHQFILQAVQEALRWPVVPAVSLATHRADHAVFLELGLEAMTGVLTTPVRVMHQPQRRLPAEPSHGHSRLDRPADDFVIEEIEYHRQIEPALVRLDVGQAVRPHPFGRGRREVPFQHVRRHQQVRVRCRLEPALVPGATGVLPPEPKILGTHPRSSIYSGVTCFAPGPFSFPASNTLTQLRSACSIKPNSRATTPAVCPAFTRYTASSLNSAVYSYFGIFNFASPSKLSRVIPHLLEDEISGESQF